MDLYYYNFDMRYAFEQYCTIEKRYNEDVEHIDLVTEVARTTRRNTTL